MIETGDEKAREKIVQRPTILERQLNVYAGVLKLVENFVDVDIGAMVRSTFLSESWIPFLGKSNTLDWVQAQETEVKYDGAVIGSYVNWFSEFVSKKLPAGGIVYSPIRKAFVSKTGMLFKAELYTDIMELRSLVNLVGPYGVKAIDRELLKFIQGSVNNLKEYVSHNKNVLEELRLNYFNEVQSTETLKKIRDGDAFVMKAIAIGNTLCLRSTLHEALRLSVQEKAPYVYNTVNSSFNEYRRNTFMLPDFLPTDLLAHDCGIVLGTADQPLKQFLGKTSGGDAQLWDLLPLMFAASFTTNVWKDAQWKPAIEGHTNNAHTLARTINDLIIAFKSNTPSANPDEKDIANLLKSFVEVSSVILLRMARTNYKQDKHPPVDFPSIIIFIDRFIEACPLLTAEVMESCLPYALLRSEWRSIYSEGDAKKGVRGDVF